ncbi:HNH endonuclease [Pantoea eucrina]|uniref:HNH endonuclease n=1 Tax=Pantoea eucrina TaxID=472693 RepID=UPI001CC43BA6|nr:HNH endonuclease [Pantoea eucrina]UBB12363.1 HNH endonuclease [Pantoea eucrina]
MKKAIDLSVIEAARKRFHYDQETGKFYRLRGRTTKRRVAEEVTLSNHGYINLSFLSTKYMAHRIAWALVNGPLSPDVYIDHIDGDKINNRASNLRIATKQQNSWNVGLNKQNKSGVKGVHFDSYTNMWRASCQEKKIGRFKTIEEAAEAVRSYREKAHGEFANHGEARS